MMSVIIEEIKEVMCSSLLELLTTKKQLDQTQTVIDQKDEKIRYYRESYEKVTESRVKCMIVQEDFKKDDYVLFHFDEKKQNFVAQESNDRYTFLSQKQTDDILSLEEFPSEFVVGRIINIAE